MASIRFRNNKWQARVIRKGHEPVARSFLTKLDAERWSRSIESEMDKGAYVSTSEAEQTTLGELITRYMKEVTPSFRGAKEDLIRLNAIRRRPIAKLSLTALTPSKLAIYRDERLTQVKANTLIRELAYLSSIINHARREWSINIPNPVSLVKKPSSPQGRSRILSDEERTRLINAVKPINNRVRWIKPLILLALETGMRRGELLGLTINNIDLVKQVAYLDLTKNGDSRYVPLSLAAIKIIKELPLTPDGRLFPIKAHCVSTVFNRARDRAKLEDLHFHDLRHTAITHLAEKLPNLLELSSVTGHKSLKMLKRYYHPDPQSLAKKLG
jgi:integrase